jgi:hypothetical protein
MYTHVSKCENKIQSPKKINKPNVASKKFNAIHVAHLVFLLDSIDQSLRISASWLLSYMQGLLLS